MESQVIPGEKIKSILHSFGEIKSVDDIIRLGKYIYTYIEVIPCESINEIEKEMSIRWKRTGEQIINDGFVYKGKACTDIVIIFLTFCNYFGIKNNFLKIKKDKFIHSVAEIVFNGESYIYDVSVDIDNIYKGNFFLNGNTWKGWTLWKKGRDSWDLGLVEYNSYNKIN